MKRRKTLRGRKKDEGGGVNRRKCGRKRGRRRKEKEEEEAIGEKCSYDGKRREGRKSSRIIIVI